ncbi:MAG: 50S ribosomal protein L30 [Acidobacteria bacterium]|nr:50S ribosomal protein L30 [Acidobacteriota bacterium]
MAKQGEGKKIAVKLIRSGIGFTRHQKEILVGLGLRKLNRTVELCDNPSIRGMVAKVPHLVKIVGTRG